MNRLGTEIVRQEQDISPLHKKDAAEATQVLVVDDEESVRELLRLILEQAGYRVVLAPNGQEALRKFLIRDTRPGVNGCADATDGRLDPSATHPGDVRCPGNDDHSVRAGAGQGARPACGSR